VVGQVYEGAAQDVEDAGLSTCVEFVGYVPHAVALSYLLSADASLLLIRKGDLGSVTGKVFELLMVRKPIIALAEPDGECARILAAANANMNLSRPEDKSGLATTLRAFVDGRVSSPDPLAIEKFSRVNQAAELAKVLDRVSEGGTPTDTAARSVTTFAKPNSASPPEATR
jgi:glycosyltransferase involved in cell wall biosynthesis